MNPYRPAAVRAALTREEAVAALLAAEAGGPPAIVALTGPGSLSDPDVRRSSTALVPCRRLTEAGYCKRCGGLAERIAGEPWWWHLASPCGTYVNQTTGGFTLAYIGPVW